MYQKKKLCEKKFNRIILGQGKEECQKFLV